MPTKKKTTTRRRNNVVTEDQYAVLDGGDGLAWGGGGGGAVSGGNGGIQAITLPVGDVTAPVSNPEPTLTTGVYRPPVIITDNPTPITPITPMGPGDDPTIYGPVTPATSVVDPADTDDYQAPADPIISETAISPTGEPSPLPGTPGATGTPLGGGIYTLGGGGTIPKPPGLGIFTPPGAAGADTGIGGIAWYWWVLIAIVAIIAIVYIAKRKK